MIRPQPAIWFEIIAARDDAMMTLELLAATGSTEIEPVGGDLAMSSLSAVAPLLREYTRLAQPSRPYWPRIDSPPAACEGAPSATLAKALTVIQTWALDAGARVQDARAAETEFHALRLWGYVLEHTRNDEHDLLHRVPVNPRLQTALFLIAGDESPSLPPGLVSCAFDDGRNRLILARGEPEDMDTLGRQVAAAGGQRISMPQWFSRDYEVNRERIAARIREARHRIASLRADIDALNTKHGLSEALTDVARACWCFQNLEDADAIFARFTGWTNDPEGLLACLEKSAARAIAHFPRMPEDRQPPLLLHNPDWIRPFEIFARLAGMPGRFTTDPSGLLVFIAPLLFGYMFGDVIQGLVLVVLGLALHRRWPMLRLLVAGGFAAVIFGFVFGSAGSIHGLVHPLWMEPLDDPLPVLFAPLVFGSILLALGLSLNGLESYWRGELAMWLTGDVGFLLLYVGIILLLLHSAGLVLGLLGIVLFVTGRARRAKRATAAIAAIGELVEKCAQILVNTLSFVRVGAFALAHAGLSSALASMADATSSVIGHVLVLVIGNVLIIVTEVMVASIQTTRLVLLEFFTRFFVSTGREFHPLPAPSASS
jgi:V/A-type H+-transporting ATPase subunit I